MFWSVDDWCVGWNAQKTIATFHVSDSKKQKTGELNGKVRIGIALTRANSIIFVSVCGPDRIAASNEPIN